MDKLPKPVQIPSFVCSGTMVIELREFNDKKKKMSTMANFVIIWPTSGSLMVHRLLFKCSVL